MRKERGGEREKGFRRGPHQRQYSTRTAYAKGAYAAHVPAGGGKALAFCLLNNVPGEYLETRYRKRARKLPAGTAGVIALY